MRHVIFMLSVFMIPLSVFLLVDHIRASRRMANGNFFAKSPGVIITVLFLILAVRNLSMTISYGAVLMGTPLPSHAINSVTLFATLLDLLLMIELYALRIRIQSKGE